jgi:hypothetical protein
MRRMHHSKVLRAGVAAAVTATAAVAAATGASATAADGWRTLAQAEDGGTTVKLEVARTLLQESPFREAQFSVTAHLPEQVDADGSFTAIGSGTLIPVRASDRPNRPLNVEADRSGCTLTAIAGVAHARVAKVVLVDADGRRRAVRLRTPPKTWAYRGHLIGTILEGRAMPKTAQALDVQGRTLQTVALRLKRC